MKVTQKREGDKINFYTSANECVATLFDGQDEIIFDELACGAALLDNSLPSDYVRREFEKMGLDVFAARYIDAARTPDINL